MQAVAYFREIIMKRRSWRSTMTNQEKNMLRTVLTALVVTAAIIAALLLPAPPAQAPSVELEPELHFVEKAQAAEVAPEPKRSAYDDLADRIIECESNGRNVEIIDTNGEWSRGVAQFQDKTWSWMSQLAGVEGSPLEPEKARAVLVWALETGRGSHWTCYYKVTH